MNPAPEPRYTPAEIVEALANVQRQLSTLAHVQIAGLVKDRIDLREALDSVTMALRCSFDQAGNSMDMHYSVREALKVLRRTA